MKILNIESSSKNCSVCISENEGILSFCEELSESYKQSENLHVFIKWALEGAGIRLIDLDAICIGMGPGSYTGMRIGAASAKGFCFGLDVPLISVNSLDTIAEPFLKENYRYIIPMIDARRNEVYHAFFDGLSGEKKGKTKPLILDENSFEELRNDKILIVGDGAKKASEILNLPNASFRWDVYPSSRYLVRTAVKKFRKKEFSNVDSFEPFYLKDFQGTKKKNSLS